MKIRTLVAPLALLGALTIPTTTDARPVPALVANLPSTWDTCDDAYNSPTPAGGNFGTWFGCIDLRTGNGPKFYAWNGQAKTSPAVVFGLTIDQRLLWLWDCPNQTATRAAPHIEWNEFQASNYETYIPLVNCGAGHSGILTSDDFSSSTAYTKIRPLAGPSHSVQASQIYLWSEMSSVEWVFITK